MNGVAIAITAAMTAPDAGPHLKLLQQLQELLSEHFIKHPGVSKNQVDNLVSPPALQAHLPEDPQAGHPVELAGSMA